MYILEATGKIYISIRSLSIALTNKKSVLPLSRVWARFNSKKHAESFKALPSMFHLITLCLIST